jgi:hypothetical protein
LGNEITNRENVLGPSENREKYLGSYYRTYIFKEISLNFPKFPKALLVDIQLGKGNFSRF